jgi:hypothetical protein
LKDDCPANSGRSRRTICLLLGLAREHELSIIVAERNEK